MQNQTREAALAARPAVVLTPAQAIDVAGLNTMAVGDRLAAVQEIINNVNESVLARASWAMAHRGVLNVLDLEEVADELMTTPTVIQTLRRLRTNADQDRMLHSLSDGLNQAQQQLTIAMLVMERAATADLFERVRALREGAGGSGSGLSGGHSGGGLGNGDDASRTAKPRAARERIRPGQGVTHYTGVGGEISVNEFLLAINDLFNAADQGSSEPLTAADKIAHVRTCIDGKARDVLRLEEENLRNGCHPFSAQVLQVFDIPAVWRDVTVHHPVDFTDFLRFIFSSRSEADMRKEEYRAIVARGYVADPDTLRRQLQQARIAIGTARPDLAVSNEQLLQDFLSLLPHEHRKEIYSSSEFTRTGGEGLTIDVAARIAQNYHRALLQSTPSGARDARLTALLPGEAHQRVDTADTKLAALQEAINVISEKLTTVAAATTANQSLGDGGGSSPLCAPVTSLPPNDSDSLNAVAAAAAHNASLFSLAQRQYNSKRRLEMKQGGAGKRFSPRVRCWGCGQLGHVQAECTNPPMRAHATPFRRVRHRGGGNAGFTGGQRPVKFFRRDPNTHRLTALQDHEFAAQEDYVLALEVGDEDDEDQAFVIA